MKITRCQLRQIIRESESYKHMLSKNHVFGEPWSGSPHDLAVVQGKTFGGGSVVDLKGYDIMVDAGVAFTSGSAKKMLERLRLRRILQESVGIPAWPEKHFAWRSVAFTRGEELRYILDVADPETVQATIDIGKPVPPGANVMIVMGAYPNSKEMWMHDSELLDLIEREGWYERPPPKGADPAGFWDGKGEWQEPSDDDFSLPDESLPPAISESQLRKIVREALLSEDKSGKGACPDNGCIKKGDGGWKIISNKTGKEWPQTYKTKTSAQNALKAYHARG